MSAKQSQYQAGDVEMERTSIRAPVALIDYYRERAERLNTSVNAELVWGLERGLETTPPPGESPSL